MPFPFAPPVPLTYAAYAIASVGVTRLPAGALRDGAFAIVNLVAVFLIFFGRDAHTAVAFGAYLGAVGTCYVVARLLSRRRGPSAWVAFFAPILLLAGVRYFPVGVAASLSASVTRKLALDPTFSFAPFFVGVSYLAFRCSRLVIDVRNGTAPMPSLSRYLGFAFFLPVMAVGPIHSWPEHARALDGHGARTPLGRSAGRIVIGLAKLLFLSAMVNQLSYAQLLLDGRLHTWPELFIAVVAYYLYLYLNFSGACDLAIGLASVASIPVAENFDSPFRARNVREFWNRWHITLSEYMRDLLFAPLSKRLVVRFGPKRADHAIGVTIVVVFLVMGVWHGPGWNYAAFGLAHAAAVAGNHYYALFLKRRLSKEAWRAYHASRFIRLIGVVTTFLYVAASLILLANTPTELRGIFHVLR